MPLEETHQSITHVLIANDTNMEVMQTFVMRAILPSIRWDPEIKWNKSPKNAGLFGNNIKVCIIKLSNWLETA
jgi:hypothetical protein